MIDNADDSPAAIGCDSEAMMQVRARLRRARIRREGIDGRRMSSRDERREVHDGTAEEAPMGARATRRASVVALCRAGRAESGCGWQVERLGWSVRARPEGAGRRGARQRGCRADGEDGWGMLYANRPVASEPVRARAKRIEWWWVGVVNSLGEEGEVIGKRVILEKATAGREGDPRSR